MSESKRCDICGGYTGSVIIRQLPACNPDGVPYPIAEVPPIQLCPGHDDVISGFVVREALNRLNRYYAGRARSAKKAMQEAYRDECTEAGFMLKALSVAQWRAKRDAVIKVAENLDIKLNELDEQKEGVE